MKKYLLVSIIAVGMIVMSLASVQAADKGFKFGYIDLQKVMALSAQGQVAKGKMQAKQEELRTILQKKQAETIVITELSNFANRLRLEMYKNTRVRLVKVKNENDGRVCELCKRVASATKLGVPINEIEQRIYELTNGKSRGYAIHPRCRCIIIR